MNISVWSSFSKRKNSTKQPSGGTTVTCTLKEKTSIESPVFILNSPIVDYTYVSAFGNYYFVTDVVNVNANICEVHCVMDTMASHKTEIGNTQAYVLFDTTANSEQVDARLSIKTTATHSISTVNLRSDISEAGTYIITITGTDKVGSYVVPRSTIDKLMPDITTVFDQFIQGTTPFEAIRDSIKQLVGSGALSDNIKDVRWLPFSISGDTTVYPLSVGMYDLSVGGTRIDSRLDLKSTSVTIPWQFSDWRNTEPYTQVYVYIPFVGVVNYPASQLKGASSLAFDVSLDKITGDLAILVKTNNGSPLGSYGASTGVTIPVGSSGIGGMNIANAIITGASAIASGSVTGLASSALSAVTPVSQSVGGISSGAGAELDKRIIVCTICHDTAVSPSSVSSAIGTPTNAVKTINTLSGYIQCNGASVDINGFDTDRVEINSFLNSGFFYE